VDVFLEALWICVVTLATLTFLGYGLTRLLMPRSLSPEGLLWTPFVGFTLASIVYHALNIAYLDVRQATAVLFAIAAVFGGVALIRGRHIAAPSAPIFGGLMLVSVLVLFASLAPLAAIGHLTAISMNHDLIDIYDAAAAYVIDHPVASILSESQPNPLATLVAGPIVLSNGWGLTYVHALASILTNRSTIETQTPVFSVTHALIVPAVYVLLRRAAIFPSWLALAASAALGVHGMLLSVLLIGLGNHTVMLALLPLLLVATFIAIDERSAQSVALAGLMVANIPLTYWVAFAFYLPPVVVYALLGPTSPFAAHWPRLASSRRTAIIRSLANPRKTGYLLLSRRGGQTEVLLNNGRSVSASVEHEHRRAALGLLVGSVAAGEFVSETRPVATGDVKLDGPELSGFLKKGATNGVPSPSGVAGLPGSLASPTPARHAGAVMRRRVALVGAVLGSVLVALPGYQRIVNNIQAFSATSQGWGGASYADLELVPGLSVWAYPWAYPTPTDLRQILGDAIGGAVLALQTVAFVVAILLATLALVRSRRPWRGRAALASIFLGYAGLLFYLRFIRPYPYGYFKAITSAALFGVPLVAEGLALAWATRSCSIGRIRIWMRPPTLVLTGALVGVLLLDSALTIVAYSDQTETDFRGSVVPPSSVELSEMEAHIPPGASVFVSEWPANQAQVVSAVAYFLRDHPLYGRITTLESALDNPPPSGAVPDYGVLASSEDPLTRGYDPAGLVWSNADVKLYKRGQTVAHLDDQSATIPIVRHDQPLELALTPDGIGINKDATGEPRTGVAARQLILELGTLQPEVLRLAIDGHERELRLDAGVSRIATESISVPARVTLMPESDANPIFARSLSLRDTPDAPSSVTDERDILLAVPNVEVQGSSVRFGLRYAGADDWTPHMSVSVNISGTAEPGGDWAEFAWWAAELRSQRSAIQMDLDLATRQASAMTSLGQTAVNSSLPEVKDGDYTARLGFWESTQASLGWQSSTYDLFAFQMRDGEITTPEGRAEQVIFLPWRTNYTVTAESTAAYQTEAAEINQVLHGSAEVRLGPGLRKMPSAVAALVESLSGVTFAADFLAGANYVEAGHVYDFAILDRSDDPAQLGYQPQNRLLTTNDFTVYKRGNTLAHLDLSGNGGYPRLDAGQSLTFQATADAVTMDPTQQDLPSAEGVRRRVTLEFGSLAPSQVAVSVGNNSPRVLQLAAGVTRYETEALDLPMTVALTGASAESASVIGVDLVESDAATPQLVFDPDVMLVSTRLTSNAEPTLAIDLRWAGGADDAARRFFMGVNLNGYSVPEHEWFAGTWWGMQMADRKLHLNLDLETHEGTGAGTNGPIPVMSRLYAAGDGDYEAQLSLWEAGLASRGWQTPYIPLFTSQVRNGHVTRVAPEDTPLAVVSLLAPTDTATPAMDIATPAATKTPAAATMTPAAATLLDQEFDNDAPGWPNNPNGPAWFADRAYHLGARIPGQFVAIGAPLPGALRDVEVSATFQKTGGPPGGGYGLIIRDQGPLPRDGLNQDGHYYVLEAGDDGRVGIWRRDGKTWTDLVGWRPSAAVHSGRATNELVARAIGERLTLLVNGMEAASVTDAALDSGSTGIFVGGDFNQVAIQRVVVRAP
jgi:hypothetical protein